MKFLGSSLRITRRNLLQNKQTRRSLQTKYSRRKRKDVYLNWEQYSGRKKTRISSMALKYAPSKEGDGKWKKQFCFSTSKGDSEDPLFM
jgi:hypothetical protein